MDETAAGPKPRGYFAVKRITEILLRGYYQYP